MSIITNPIESIKNQAHKIWDTKDFAERLAINRTTWFLHMLYCYLFVMVLETFTVIIINDLFILHDFYSSGTNWVIDTIQEIYFSIHPLVETTIIFFWVAPKIVKTTLLISKAYSNKEKAFFEWIEFKIKVRYPSYKTTSQKAREREQNPREKGKLKKRYDGYMEKRNDVERLLIRGTIWGVYGILMVSLVLFMLGSFTEFFNMVMDIEPDSTMTEQEFNEARDILIDQLIEQQEVPTRPDGMPPNTIFDVFISKPDTVIP